MTDSKGTASPENVSSQPQPALVRFTLSQRIEHLFLLVSFTVLGVTGLPQKYAESPASQWTIGVFGGIEMTRLIHHIAAVILLLVSIFHIIAVLYRVWVLRTPLSMFPVIEDFKHLFQDLSYYMGVSKHKAYYGRYNYAEKVEYLAVVWGTLIMAITGFMMWNPIATTRLLPGEMIPASKAAHGGEAVLAVLSIILWHFYHVHLKHFNKSMFTGKLTRKEMEHEHPGELAMIDAGKGYKPPEANVLKRRNRIFLPVAGVFAGIMLVGLYGFVSYEESAITTLPSAETLPIYVPITPTPRPTPTPSPTSEPGSVVAGADTWEGSYFELFRNRCSTCHGLTAVGELSLIDYQSALKGGKSGPGIVPGDPDSSMIVKIQKAGNHPGQLSTDEINRLIEWIKAGAPEK
jgi:cytochrome b subunit of formate dehydrogenase